MKIMKIHEFHKFCWFCDPPRNPMNSLLKIKVWAAWTSKILKTIKINIFAKFTKNQYFPNNSWKICKMMQKNTFWRILVVPWPPHAENLNIPIGILMFSTIPGGLQTLQKRKIIKISPKLRKFRKNHENSANFMKFHEISGNYHFLTIFRKLGAQKPWYSLGKTMIWAQGRPSTAF